jgi:hypothetical protein
MSRVYTVLRILQVRNATDIKVGAIITGTFFPTEVPQEGILCLPYSGYSGSFPGGKDSYSFYI